MRSLAKILLAIATAAPTVDAQLINEVVNAANNIQYSPLSPGAIATIWGYGIGPSQLQFASLPLPTALGGTSVAITVNGTTVVAPVYYTWNGQVGVVVPSNTPTGDGKLSLTYNGASTSIPVTIVASNFGIINSPPIISDPNGFRSIAIATSADYRSVTAANSATPGDTLILWGAGLGATPHNGGDIGAPPAGDIGDIPKVFVGGIQSPSVTYWGRSPNSTPGLDQVVFIVPSDAPLGCNISVVVQTGPTQVSNAPTISVATAHGAACSDSNATFPPAIFGHDGLKTLTLGLAQTVTIEGNADGSTSQTYLSGATATSVQISALRPEDMPQYNDQPTLGACYGLYGYGPDGNGFPGQPLEAEATLTLTPPSGGTLTLPSLYSGYYDVSAPGALPIGAWTLSNGAGGADIAPFHFNFNLSQPVEWTNATAVLGHPLDRTQPLMIAWSGGDASSYVTISGYAGDYGLGAFTCAAPAAAGAFAIPPSILLALPPAMQGQISVATVALPLSFGNAPGFDVTLNNSVFTTIATPVIYQ